MISVGRFSVRYWKEPECGYGGQCIELPDATNQGETFEELKTNMEDAIRLMLEYRKEVNMTVSKDDEPRARITLEKLHRLQSGRKVQTTTEHEAWMIGEDRQTH